MPVSSVRLGVKVVDFHVHAFPDEVAGRAMQTLQAAYQTTAVTDGTIAAQLRLMEQSGVDYSVIQPVATKPSQVRSINDWAASISDPRIIAFGGIHPDFDDIPGEIDRIAALGIPGIKIQANWQGVYVDDPRMSPIYEAAQGRLILMFHSGEELTPFDDLKATPARLANVLRDFPRLTMVAAHMGGYRVWDDVDEHLVGKDLYFDTSACFPSEMPDERLVDMIRRHGPEKVLFATDLPLNEPVGEVKRLAELGLTDAELELILWKNAQRLLPGRIS